MKGEIEKEMRALTREHKIPLQYVPKEKLNSIAANANHQGLAAMLSLVNYMELDEVLPHIYEQGKAPALLVIDGVEDVRNLGALARSAVWFDMDAIIVGMKKTAQINSFAYKASAGALKDIIICREGSIIKALQYLKDSGIKIVVADVQPDVTRSKIDYKEPIALVMGSEGRGPVREVVALADAITTIPGSGKVESLNVSVAGALLMSEIFKQRT